MTAETVRHNNEEMIMANFRRIKADYRMYRSTRSQASYRPYGSDDGYDHYRDNRDGSVDDYVAFVEEWRKNREKTDTPENGG